MKRSALWILWLTILTEVTWIAVSCHRHHVGIQEFWYADLMTIGFTALAATRGSVRWVAASVRILIALAFISAVCDRLGFMGGPGSPGVAWGNFQRFVLYTGQVNAFLPSSLIPSLAVIETVIEALLGVAMLIGWRVRVATWSSTLLLLAFLVAMTISLGFASQFPYAVLVMVAGAWVLAVSDASRFSVDGVFRQLAGQRSG